MWINQIPLNLLKYQKQHNEHQRLKRTHHKDQKRPDRTSDKCSKNRYQCRKCNHNSGQQCIWQSKQCHRDYKHCSKDQSLHALSRQKTRKCLIRQSQHFQYSFCSPLPDKRKQYFFRLSSQFLFLQQNINCEYKCNKKRSHCTNNIFCRINGSLQHTSRSVFQKACRRFHNFIPVKFQVVHDIHNFFIIMEPVICPPLHLRDKLLNTLSQIGKCSCQLRKQPEYYHCQNSGYTGNYKHQTDSPGIFSFIFFRNFSLCK